MKFTFPVKSPVRKRLFLLLKKIKKNYTAFTKSFDFGDGRTITLETGKLAKQAHGSVVLTMG
ncbi:MAG: hypothetical protein ACKVQB_03910, partial [Bacteroidia bacterium]